MQKIKAVILAGGSNKRMKGEKKLFLTLGQSSFFEMLLAALSDMDDVILSVDDISLYEGTDISLIEDRYKGIGPIGGICSVLEELEEGVSAVFVTACDMPFLGKSLVYKFLEVSDRYPGHIIAARQKGWVNPLCGVYPEKVLPEMRNRIKKGQYKLQDLIDSVDHVFVDVDPDDRSLININSVDEYVKECGDMPLEIENAIDILKGSISPVDELISVPIASASGYIIGEDVTADMDQPPFPRSPLDGYAVRAADIMGASEEDPASLKVIGKIYAGQVFDGSVCPGECVRIMTGAPIPEGADTIVRQEDTDYVRNGISDTVRIYKTQKAYDNYCRQGDDFHRGDVLIKKGTRVNASVIAVAAGNGCDMLKIYRPVKVAVISTGDEVIQPGNPLAPGKIYDSNLAYVTGRLFELKNINWTGMHCSDEIQEMAGMIRELAKENDLIVTTGGVSVGEKDIMHGVLDALGAKKLFWKVNLKPGAPTLAFITDNTLVICLTGNPYGVIVNFELLVRPVLEKLSHGAVRSAEKAAKALLEDSPKKANKRRFLKGVLEPDGVRFAEGSQSSGNIAAMVSCSCLIELPAGSRGKAGDMVQVHLLGN